MALASTDPKVLMGQAKCFSCLTPHQQIQDQTYLLAKIGGFDTSYAGVQSFSVLAKCFSCLTVYQLKRVKQYLIAVWLGLDTSQSGIQAQVQAAKCFTCLTPRQQQTVDTYLLAVAAGLDTSVTGVRAIQEAGKCFGCLDTKQQYEVQVYILGQLSGVSSTAPSDLMAAAKCFESCLIPELEEALLASLSTQIGNRLTPPCVTPTAPLASAGAKVITNTTIRILWNEINTGSLVTSYTVKWGTASGVYTNSVTVPVSPTVYTITGLTPGTQYFWVIVANSFTGCSSANSNEGTATTSGAAPGNHLLNGLVSYWSFDATSAGTFPDLQNGNPLTFGGGVFPNGGIINNSFGYGGNGGVGVAPCPAAMQLGAGKSFTISTWWFGPGGVSQEGQMGQFSGVAATSAWIVITAAGSSNLTLAGWTGGVQATLSGIGLMTAAWHHVVFGFDSPNQQLFAYFDNGAKQTQGTTGDLNGVNAGFQGGTVTGQAVYNGGAVDETGFWNRVLSAADVANLFNGGAGLPFTSFTP